MAITNQALGFASGTNVWSDTDIAGTVVVVKASSAVVHLITIDNTGNGAATYVKLFNTAGAVTLGTTVPDEVIYVPASVSITLVYPGGKTFGTGLEIAATTAGGTAGSTGPTSDVTARIVYV